MSQAWGGASLLDGGTDEQIRKIFRFAGGPGPRLSRRWGVDADPIGTHAALRRGQLSDTTAGGCATLASAATGP